MRAPTPHDPLGLSRRWPIRASVGLVAAAAVVLAAVWSGRRYVKDPDIKLGAAPLVGEWLWRPTWLLGPAAVVAVVVVLFGPRCVARMSPGWAITVAGAASAAFAMALASADGASQVLTPVVHPTEYWANLDALPPAGEMIRRFSDVRFLLDYSVHVKGHPPGFVLLLKGLAALGLGEPWVTAAVSVAGTALMTVGVLLTVRVMAGDDAMRRVAPFLVVIPFAVWTGVSADAFFAGVAAMATAAGAHAIVASTPRRRILLGLACGLLLGWSFILGYGAATFLAVPALVLVGLGGRAVTPRVQAATGALIGFAAVLGGFALLGFWWWDGLSTTRTLYWWGTAQFRPWRYFLLANVAATLIAVGPAVVAGVATMRRSVRWWLVAGALVAITASNLSQYSKGEVERIWLIFFPWLVPAVAQLPRPRLWLAVQAGCTLVLQAWLVSKW